MELLIFAGDLMFDDLRPILHRAFPNAPIVSMGLSSNDAGLIAAPVPGADVRAHEAFANRTIIEIVEESTGEPITEPGRVGRLLVTNLFRTLMPIIRYPCGDRAEWVDPARQRFRLVGRAQEGARVSYVNMLIEDTRAVLIEADPGRHMVGMQMVVRRYDGRDELTLRLGYVEPPPPQLSEQLIAAVYRRRPEFAKEVDIDSAHPLRIEWVPRADLQTHPLTGKLQQVIDDRLQG